MELEKFLQVMEIPYHDIEIFNGEGYGRVIDSQWIIQDISSVEETTETGKDRSQS